MWFKSMLATYACKYQESRGRLYEIIGSKIVQFFKEIVIELFILKALEGLNIKPSICKS